MKRLGFTVEGCVVHKYSQVLGQGVDASGCRVWSWGGGWGVGGQRVELGISHFGFRGETAVRDRNLVFS